MHSGTRTVGLMGALYAIPSPAQLCCTSWHRPTQLERPLMTESTGAAQHHPKREADRLAALHRYGVLDTEDEAAFDGITQLVQRLLDVPIALVTLVDEERQWLKSCVGLEQRETPREIAFCNHNIRGDGVMVVEDATADPRFADNPLVTGPPHMRFYAGAPLLTDDGYALGALCAIDTKPRSLSADDRATLETLAAVVVDAMTMRTHYAREHEILEHIGDGFIALDADWRFTYVNGPAEDALGQGREDLLGRSLWEVFPEALGSIFEEKFHQAIRTGEVAEFEAYFPPLKTWFRVKARPSEQGSSQGLSVYLDDMTQQRKCERDLRHTQQLLDSIIENANVGIYVTDADGRFVRVSPAYVDIYGWSREELIGEPFTKVLPPGDREEGMEAHDRFIYDRIDETTGEWRVQQKDGTLRTVIVTAGRMEQDGEPFKVTTVMDVTKRKQAEEALNAERDLLENIFNTIAAGVLVVDTDGVIVRANEAAAEAQGLAPHDVCGRMYNDSKWHITTLEGEPFPDEARPFVRVMETEAPVYDTRYKVHAPNGERLIVSVSGAPLREADGTLTGAVFVINDITEQVETRQQLISAKEEAETASQLKSALLSNMSHEIRTPLSAIIGFADVLRNELSGTHRDYVENVYRGGERLLGTLNSMLRLSKLEAGMETLDPSAFDLASELDEIVDTLDLQATEAGVDLQLTVSERPLQMVSDRNALYRIVVNLARNAIKFTEAGGRVELRATHESDQRNGDHVIMEVEDTGIGMSDEFQSRLFEAFTQESTGVRREHEGSGLGLAIVDRLVDLVGGTMDVESTKGEGTTFKVVLPASCPTA